jgi:chromosome segregation protein
MRLRSLTLVGFKSFLDKTVVTLEPGISAFVGPNGCGKSNLADAILWTLGEQSPKALRGERMEDVIFNGTQTQKATGMAEVSLVLTDIAGQLQPPYATYSEISISRCLYRSGECDYTINQIPVRLKDVRDLLIDAGVGYRAHNIIEQGKVDRMVLASPLQRREIVEEAAGITKYRLRKAEALRKLDATEQNLLRVRDIIAEVKRQMNALDRQAKKAEKYRQFKTELTALEVQAATRAWHQWKQTLETLASQESEGQTHLLKFETELSQHLLRQEETRLILTEKETVLSGLRSALFEVETGIQRLEGKIETCHVQRKEWRDLSVRIEKEVEEIRATEGALGGEQAQVALESEAVSRGLPEQESELTQQGAVIRQLEQETALKTSTLEQHRQGVFRHTTALAQAHNNRVHIQTRLDDFLRRKERGAKEATETQQQKATRETEVAMLSERLAGLSLQHDQTASAHAGATAQAREVEARLLTDRKGLVQAREVLVKTTAQAASREGFYRGLLPSEPASLPRTGGIIADLLDVPVAYEAAIEAVLENRLRGIVLENHAEVQRWISYLQASESGRATLFLRAPRLPQDTPAVTGDGIMEARSLVGCRPGYGAIAALLLDGVVLVEDFDAALRHWNDAPHVRAWATQTGEVLYASGIVSVGKQSGILEQKRELAALSAQMGRLQDEVRSFDTKIEVGEETLRATRLRIESLGRELRTTEMEQLNLRKDHAVALSENARLQTVLSRLLLEESERERDATALTGKIQQESDQIVVHQQAIAEQESGLREAEAALLAQHHLLSEAKAEGTRLTLATASLRDRGRHLREKMEQIVKSGETLRRRLAEKKEQQASLSAQIEAGVTEEAQIVAAIGEKATERERLLGLQREKQAEQATLAEALRQGDQVISQLRVQAGRTQKGLQDVALSRVEAELTQRKIQETTLMNDAVDVALLPPPPPDETAPEDTGRIAQLRQSLSDLGEVHVGAISEHQELSERFGFLSTQEGDLVTSMDSLKAAIVQINQTTRGLFVSTFHRMNEKFQEVFTTFFGGGTAAMVLSDEEHPLESGIELIAQPPGKKPRSLALLSGGEKALCAISLLFATFLIHPGPFCLLDEVDAPLDEENARRFTGALRTMSEKIQIIVITHNKRTMEASDVLYGVTMEEPGLSRLVSVRLRAHDRDTASIPPVSVA